VNGGPDLFIDAAFRHGPGIEHSSRLRKRDLPDVDTPLIIRHRERE
jgi:hypothetical protein